MEAVSEREFSFPVVRYRVLMVGMGVVFAILLFLAGWAFYMAITD